VEKIIICVNNKFLFFWVGGGGGPDPDTVENFRIRIL
jgi:hypothetical protein